ncbi:MAG TPA: helix-turn-helix transcriptional regulator [Terriglobia bacterium]|jgi:transcriptional regulator with XRE-family HTH domain|nr:helix-turn-helix transcriptional regulator [Terriglobia bacterium]
MLLLAHSSAARPNLKSKEYVKQYRRFLQKLKQARKDSGLTQAEVSRLIGQPQSFVSKYESGERRVDFVELQFLAKTFDKPIDFFRTPDDA